MIKIGKKSSCALFSKWKRKRKKKYFKVSEEVCRFCCEWDFGCQDTLEHARKEISLVFIKLKNNLTEQIQKWSALIWGGSQRNLLAYPKHFFVCTKFSSGKKRGWVGCFHHCRLWGRKETINVGESGELIHFGGKRPGCCLVWTFLISKKNLAILIRSIPFFNKNHFPEKMYNEKVELKIQS